MAASGGRFYLQSDRIFEIPKQAKEKMAEALRTMRVTERDWQRPQSVANFGLNILGLLCGMAVVLALTIWGDQLRSLMSVVPGIIRPGLDTDLIVSIAGCISVFLVIAVGEIFWYRCYLVPSAGLTVPTARHADVRHIAIRLLGLAFTLSLAGLSYWLFSEYHGSFYDPYWKYLCVLAVLAIPLSIPYFAWIDRRLVNRSDAYWQLGSLALGGREKIERRVLTAHFSGWAVKAFFMPLMIVYLVREVHSFTIAFKALSLDTMSVYHFLYEFSYTIDLLFCVVGYTITLRLFDSHIRGVDPTISGCLVALICYQPFYSVIRSAYLSYDDSIYWDNWLAPWPVLRGLWAILIVVLLFFYSFYTVAFGLRFSNITYRGIITNGPYRFSKHPAYLSKVLSWWLISVPWLSDQGVWEGFRHCAALTILSFVYYLRARTEENHLGLRDPNYVAYALWIDEHGLLSRLGRLIPALRYQVPPGKQV